MLRPLLHLFVVANYAFGQWYDLTYVDIPGMSFGKEFIPMKGRLKFLTIWNMLLQGLFFTICFLNDVIGTNDVAPKKVPLIRKIKDVLLPSLAFPISMFVGVTFWGLYFVDRELVFPKVLDEFFPTWLNHVMHTNIMLFIVLEMATSFRKYPTRKTGLTILTVFSVTYLIWIHVIHSKTGVWVYPVLDVLPLPGRIVFFIGSLVLQIGLYLLGEKLNNTIWRKQVKTVPHKPKKH